MTRPAWILIGLVCLGFAVIGVLRLSTGKRVQDATTFKTVYSQSKSVEFRLPTDWKSVPDGDNQMYYRDSGPGTLRLTVFIKDLESNSIELADLRKELQKTWGAALEEISPHPNGGVLWKSKDQPSVEEGVNIVTIFWVWASQTGGRAVYALYSYTAEKGIWAARRTQRDIAMLDREIRAAIVALK
ncbi:MAG: hypothetical protein K1X67_25100 [Fimbriimonadaceae bacterium]|nr:hypothetical protein [Fimbriimonadaceae bacterium]